MLNGGAAELLVAAPAYRAFAAAEPGMHQPAVADLDALGVGADGDDFADILMPHGQRQFDAAIGELEPLAAAEIVVAFPDMQVAMADAGGDDLEQDLGAGRLRRRPLHQSQRRATFADIIAFHRTDPSLWRLPLFEGGMVTHQSHRPVQGRSRLLRPCAAAGARRARSCRGR